MDRVKIAFFDTKPYDQEYFQRITGNYPADVKYFPMRLGPDSAALAAGYDGVCIFVNDSVDAQTADILYRGGTKLIALRCAGYNNIDLKAVYEKIHVVRVPAYSPHAVAEYAVSLLLTLNRKTHKAYSRIRDGNFSLNGLVGFDLYGKTAGIIGTGKIGQVAAEILRGFGMDVLASDPYPNGEWAQKNGVTYTGRDELFRSADVVSLHCPLTPENYHMVNGTVLDSMKPGAVIINTGRGALIDTKALIEAIKKNKIGGAGLDVYEEEDEYFFEDHSGEVIQDDVLARLMTFPNVLITSHQAFLTREALGAIAETTMNNIRDFFEKNELPHEVCYRCAQDSCVREKTGKCF
ncbi:2-hydroxyacid dehydrogenase [Breznakiella homolactica]|uniref:2-hydroxyacid dehydrogenase n=1 Tax=Breznakiella homolactica TaxID=2798577 RepID=A0A7T7XQY9_9SPIR|nr:2-hydroxyacid dehydrogenase [Breznakiella homolactica]QQO10861.1 2-hydroxyacid dehydrogenase [Breznakiella homolactica]